MKTKIRNSISGLLVIPLLLACFALLPRVQASPDPPALPGGNVRDGSGTLAHRTTGVFNSAFGTNALNSLTSGNNNAAQGNSALFSDVDGNTNVAVGVLALRLNVHGDQNTAVGYSALLNNTDNNNTAVGWKALGSNTSGYDNSALGFQALFSNNIGFHNNAFGAHALESVSSFWWYNVAVGWGALQNQATGDGNVAIGEQAGSNLVNGGGNVYIGAFVGGVASESGTTRIRNIYSSFANQRYVLVNSDNKLGTLSSSRRYKDEIKPMDEASEAILALKPVTFRYKKSIDPGNTPMFGLIAEEVEKVNPDLVGYNEKGEVENVRYDMVNAMLLNEFLKEHQKVQELEVTVAQQKKDMEVFAANLKEQASQIQKVSAQVELNKTAPRTVLNNQ
jgi:hypothetical protein